MVKNKNTKNLSTKRKKPRQVSRVQKPRSGPVGPVSSISTAPVSIGNTVRGSPSTVVPISGGIRVYGRDFAFQAGSTVAAATSWQLIGGMPLTPSCLTSSTLRSYAQLYQKFRINAVCFHYITSSPTSQSGDVLLYYMKDRLSPHPDFTNNSFLPFILSDENTVLGPQWSNHSACFKPTDDWNVTNLCIDTDINEDCAGAIYLFSKTSSANSPGYILMDYDISFMELCVNPRSGIIPIPRAQLSYLTIGRTTTAVTTTTAFTGAIQGTNIDGTASALPTGALTGDIYKCCAFVTNSTVSGVNAAWTNTTTANLIQYNANSFASGTATTIDDGFTFYGVYTGTQFIAYPTLENAISQTNPFFYGVTATVTWNLCLGIELVRQVTTYTQSSY